MLHSSGQCEILIGLNCYIRCLMTRLENLWSAFGITGKEWPPKISTIGPYTDFQNSTKTKPITGNELVNLCLSIFIENIFFILVLLLFVYCNFYVFVLVRAQEILLSQECQDIWIVIFRGLGLVESKLYSLLEMQPGYVSWSSINTMCEHI